MAQTEPIYCINHPKTETLLRCNRCGKPYCIKCLARTPVGYRCKECLNIQQAGYYTATSLDYAVAALAGTVASIIGGLIIAAIGGFFLIAIFYAPFAGGLIAEVIRLATQKRRGKYIWLIACGAVIVGGLMGASALPIIAALGTGNLARALLIFPRFAAGAIFNLGFLIYVVLAVGTVYARLR